jgi:hypothetical protein
MVVYTCPSGAGWHLGHPATTPLRREPHRVDGHVAPMLPTPLHKESPMKMLEVVRIGHSVRVTEESVDHIIDGGTTPPIRTDDDDQIDDGGE